jgi:hypothetical protein
MQWFLKEKEDLLRLRQEGCEWEEISTKTGHPASSCKSQYRKLNHVTKNPEQLPAALGEEEIDDIPSVHRDQGRHPITPEEQIRAELLRHGASSANVSRPPGKKFTRVPWSAGDVKRMMELRDAGDGWRVVSTKMGRSVDSCQRRFWQERNAKSVARPEKLTRPQNPEKPPTSTERPQKELSAALDEREIEMFRDMLGG